MDTLEKREHVRPVITVRPAASLAGHEFHMHRVPAAMWIALRRGTADQLELMGLALDAIVDSTVDVAELDMAELMDLTGAWFSATFEDAVPPAIGTGSEEP